jgi:hypothetical protein
MMDGKVDANYARRDLDKMSSSRCTHASMSFEPNSGLDRIVESAFEPTNPFSSCSLLVMVEKDRAMSAREASTDDLPNRLLPISSGIDECCAFQRHLPNPIIVLLLLKKACLLKAGPGYP